MRLTTTGRLLLVALATAATLHGQTSAAQLTDEPIDWRSRYLGAGLLVAAIIALAIYCWKRFRTSKRPWLLVILSIYNALLMVCFILGLLSAGKNDEGWSFLPLFFFTVPWSLSLAAILNGPIGQFMNGGIAKLFATSLLGNFVLIVVICGGLNSLILYEIIRKVFYPREA